MEQIELPSGQPKPVGKPSREMLINQILTKERSAAPGMCVNCTYCQFEINDYEIEDEEMDGDSVGVCRKNPPAYEGFPEVQIFHDYCWCIARIYTSAPTI